MVFDETGETDENAESRYEVATDGTGEFEMSTLPPLGCFDRAERYKLNEASGRDRSKFTSSMKQDAAKLGHLTTLLTSSKYLKLVVGGNLYSLTWFTCPPPNRPASAVVTTIRFEEDEIDPIRILGHSAGQGLLTASFAGIFAGLVMALERFMDKIASEDSYNEQGWFEDMLQDD